MLLEYVIGWLQEKASDLEGNVSTCQGSIQSMDASSEEKVKEKNTFAPYFRNIKVVLKVALDLFHLLTHLIRFLTTAMEAHTFVGGVAMLYMYFK